MPKLDKLLFRAAFTLPTIRKDVHRKARIEAKRLAAARGFEIEKLKDGGFNVWPPKDLAGDDQFAGGHYCNDWDEVVAMARVYAATS